MAAYLIGIAQVTNPTEKFKEYAQKSAKYLAECGGEYIVRGPAAEVVEGDVMNGRAAIIVKFPSMDALKAFYHSDTYQKDIKPLREGAGIFDMGLFEGA